MPSHSRIALPSPMYLEVSEAALMLKKVHFASVATALANIVLPLPGGPNKSRPLAGALKPLNRSGRRVGNITEVKFKLRSRGLILLFTKLRLKSAN